MRAKGFIISTDAFIALTLLAFLAVVSFFYLSTITSTSWNTIDLINTARDEAIFLEKQQIFEDAIKQQSSDILLDKVNATPNAYCIEISIFNENNLTVPMLYVLKSDCTKGFSDLATSDRTIVVNSGNNVSFYVAKIGVWYK
jgi:ABC-type amino acid transport substrate-binding protein